MNCNDYQTQMPMLLDGTGSDPESAELQDHLTRCTNCRDAMDHWQQLMSDLGAVGGEAPPDDLADRIKAAIGLESSRETGSGPGSPDTSRPLVRRLGPYRVAAAAAALIFVTWTIWQERAETQPQAPAKSTEVAHDARVSNEPMASRDESLGMTSPSTAIARSQVSATGGQSLESQVQAFFYGDSKGAADNGGRRAIELTMAEINSVLDMVPPSSRSSAGVPQTDSSRSMTATPKGGALGLPRSAKESQSISPPAAAGRVRKADSRRVGSLLKRGGLQSAAPEQHRVILVRRAADIVKLKSLCDAQGAQLELAVHQGKQRLRNKDSTSMKHWAVTLPAKTAEVIAVAAEKWGGQALLQPSSKRTSPDRALGGGAESRLHVGEKDLKKSKSAPSKATPIRITLHFLLPPY